MSQTASTDGENIHPAHIPWAVASLSGALSNQEATTHLEKALEAARLSGDDHAAAPKLRFLSGDQLPLSETPVAQGVIEPIGRYLFILVPQACTPDTLQALSNLLPSEQHGNKGLHIVAVSDSSSTSGPSTEFLEGLEALGVSFLDLSESESGEDWSQACAGLIQINWQSWLLKTSVNQGQCYAFVSYSTDDRIDGVGAGEAIRRAIAEVVPGGEESAKHVWVDTDRLKLGDNWKLSLQQAVKSVPIVFFCVTRSFLEKATCRTSLDEGSSADQGYDTAWIRRELGWASRSSRKLIPIIFYEDIQDLPVIRTLWRELTGASEQWQEVKLDPAHPEAAYPALKAVVSQYSESIKDNFTKIAELGRYLNRQAKDYPECFDLETASRLGAHLVQIDQTRLPQAAKSWRLLLQSANLQIGHSSSKASDTSKFLYKLFRKDDLSPHESILLLTAYPQHIQSRRATKLAYALRLENCFQKISRRGDIAATAWNEQLHREELSRAEKTVTAQTNERGIFSADTVDWNDQDSKRTDWLNKKTANHEFPDLINNVHQVLPPFLWLKGASNWWSDRATRIKELRGQERGIRGKVLTALATVGIAVASASVFGYLTSGLYAPTPGGNSEVTYDIKVERTLPGIIDWHEIAQHSSQKHESDKSLANGLLPFFKYRAIYTLHDSSTEGTSESGQDSFKIETTGVSGQWFTQTQLAGPQFKAPLRVVFKVPTDHAIPNFAEGAREKNFYGNNDIDHRIQFDASEGTASILIDDYQTGTDLFFTFRDYIVDEGIFDVTIPNRNLSAYREYTESGLDDSDAYESCITLKEVSLEPKTIRISTEESDVTIPQVGEVTWTEFLTYIQAPEAMIELDPEVSETPGAETTEATTEPDAPTDLWIKVLREDGTPLLASELDAASEFQAGEKLIVTGSTFAPFTYQFRGSQTIDDNKAQALSLRFNDVIQSIQIETSVFSESDETWHAGLTPNDLRVHVIQNASGLRKPVANSDWKLRNIRIGDRLDFGMRDVDVTLVEQGIVSEEHSIEVTADWINAHSHAPTIKLELVPQKKEVTLQFTREGQDVVLLREETDRIIDALGYAAKWKDSTLIDGERRDRSTLTLQAVPIATAPDINLPFLAYEIEGITSTVRLDTTQLVLNLIPKTVPTVPLGLAAGTAIISEEDLLQRLSVEWDGQDPQLLKAMELHHVPHGAEIKFSHPGYQVSFVDLSNSMETPFNAIPFYEETEGAVRSEAKSDYGLMVVEKPAVVTCVLTGDWTFAISGKDIIIRDKNTELEYKPEFLSQDTFQIKLESAKRHELLIMAKGCEDYDLGVYASLEDTTPIELKLRFADLQVGTDDSLAEAIQAIADNPGRKIVITASPRDTGPWVIRQPMTITSNRPTASTALRNAPDTDAPVFVIQSNGVVLESLWIEHPGSANSGMKLAHAVEVVGRKKTGGDKVVVNIDDGSSSSSGGSTSVTLDDCTIISGPANGVFAHGQDAVAQIRNSTIRNCANTGVVALHHAHVILSGSKIHNNQRHGIAVVRATLEGTNNLLIENNSATGLRMGPTGRAEFTNTTFRNNKETNAFISGGSQPDLSDPTHTKAVAIFEDCHLEGPGRTGLYALNHTDVVINGGILTGHLDQALWAGGQSRVHLGNSREAGKAPLKIVNNNGIGIRLDGDAELTANNVQVDRNDKSGMQIGSNQSGARGQASLIINGGSISNNGVYGVNVLSPSTIRHNGVEIKDNVYKPFSAAAEAYFK